MTAERDIHVYIAAPYGDGEDRGTRLKRTIAAMEVWHFLADLPGVRPYCPLLTYFLHELHPRDRDEWLNHSLAWLMRCDCLVAPLGDSPGVLLEITRIRGQGKPAFRSLSEFMDAYGLRSISTPKAPQSGANRF